MCVAAWVGPCDEGGRVPEDFERCQRRSPSIRTAYHGKSGHLDKARTVLEYGKLHGEGANGLLDGQNLVSNGGETVMGFLSGMECRGHDTIVSTAGHYKVSEGS